MDNWNPQCSGWLFQRKDGTWFAVDRELEEAVLRRAELRAYRAGEWDGANDVQRRRWRRRGGLALAGSLALVMLAYTSPIFLLASPVGLYVAWRALRSIDAALGTDPLPPPAVDA
jgi:hypothetical protein